MPDDVHSGPLALCFRAALTDPRTRDLPLVLETPTHGMDMDANGIWASEINVLYRMAGLQTPVRDGNGGIDVGDDGENEEAEGMKALTDEIFAVVAAAKRKNNPGSMGSSKRHRQAKGRGRQVPSTEDAAEEDEDTGGRINRST